MKIFKYELDITDKQHRSMPLGARVLSVQMQHNKIMVWAVVDPDAVYVPRTFHMYGTGHDVPDDYEKYKYLATVQNASGDFVLHVFEEYR